MNEIIKKLRLQKGLTQEELGKIIGVQKSAIRKYESGLVENMKRSSIVKLANYFEVSPAYLLGYENDKTGINDILKNLFSQLNDDQKHEVAEFIKNNLLNKN